MKKGFSSFGFIIIAFAIIFAFKDNPAETDHPSLQFSVVSESCIAQDRNPALDRCWGWDLGDEGNIDSIPDDVAEDADEIDAEPENSEWGEALEN
jgi:hypothetical protein